MYASNANKNGLWEVPVSGIAVNGQCVFSGVTLVVDVGASPIVMPMGGAAKILSSIPRAATDLKGDWAIPCSNSTQTTISLDRRHCMADKFLGPHLEGINQHRRAFGSRILLRDAVEGQKERQKCQQGDQMAIGTAYLKTVYTVLDTGENKVGFGALLHPKEGQGLMLASCYSEALELSRKQHTLLGASACKSVRRKDHSAFFSFDVQAY